MKKAGLYSSSPKPTRPARSDPDPARTAAVPPTAAGPPQQSAQHKTGVSRRARVRGFFGRHERLWLVLGSVMLSLALMFAWQQWQAAGAQKLTQKDIDQAVLHTLDKTVLPSEQAKAYEAVRRSVVRVRQYGHRRQDPDERLTGIGSGVVIVDQGVILTNLHVVTGAERVQVVFWDGTVSDATVTARQPENDLAVLQARTLPDDLAAATLRSTSDLNLGDKVIAVGFPFGIGPSVSAGVISGLHRDYSSPDGEKVLNNLIQFDAAANPGNSGGPLVTMDGSVVGIVTAILNPVDQGVFIGIAFAVPIENAASAAGESPF